MQNKNNSISNIKQAVPFFMVRNMEVSLRFYMDCLGFEMTKKWIPREKIEWCWLARGGAAIMLQEYRQGVNTAPQETAGVSICMQCEDALNLYREFIEKGLAPSDPFVGNNMWVTHLKDPDGYHLSFQSLTDVPEETTYSV